MAGRAKGSSNASAGSGGDNRKERTATIIARLEEIHPDARIALDFASPFELLIALILAAQCTDERVNRVTEGLFRKYKGPSDYVSVDREELEEDIRPTGFFRNKAKSIQACCRDLVDRHGSQVPPSMDALTELEGVGRKTANVVLGTAFGLAEGIVVDTHVGRITGRLGLTSQKDPVKIEQDLMALVPKQDWILFPHLLIHFGRATCTARSPDCGTCGIARMCPSRGEA